MPKAAGLFKINPDGTGFALLHRFALGADTSDGYNPCCFLIESGGMLYGTSVNGGPGAGTLFQISPDGSNFATLHSFGAVTGDGGIPYTSLTAVGGVLYGLTTIGPNGTGGVIFSASFSALVSGTILSNGSPVPDVLMSGLPGTGFRVFVGAPRHT